jgi:hypothetical protein
LNDRSARIVDNDMRLVLLGALFLSGCHFRMGLGLLTDSRGGVGAEGHLTIGMRPTFPVRDERAGGFAPVVRPGTGLVWHRDAGVTAMLSTKAGVDFDFPLQKASRAHMRLGFFGGVRGDTDHPFGVLGLNIGFPVDLEGGGGEHPCDKMCIGPAITSELGIDHGPFGLFTLGADFEVNWSPPIH